MKEHSPLALDRDEVNTLAVVCGCLELARTAPDFCFVDRMLEGARTLLADIFLDCVAVEEVEAYQKAQAVEDAIKATATKPNATATKPNVEAIRRKSARPDGEAAHE